VYVACVDDIYEGPGTSTWKRTYVRKVAPLKVRIATWIIDFSYDPQSWEDWGIMVLRTFPAAIAMMLVVSFSTDNYKHSDTDDISSGKASQMSSDESSTMPPFSTNTMAMPKSGATSTRTERASPSWLVITPSIACYDLDIYASFETPSMMRSGV
jgi:hypothetical protein